MLILIFIFLGLFTGLLGGLLGIGGGVITVPSLYYIFTWYGMPHVDIMHTSVATALAATTLTSMGSTWAQHRKKMIDGSILKLLVPGLVIGSILGAILSLFISNEALRIFFGAIAICCSVYFFFPRLPHFNIAPHPNRSLIGFGIVFGCLASLLGIGGGLFIIPTLLGYHVAMKRVIAVSSAGTLATALVGSIAYLIVAWNRSTIPHTVGYIEIPAFLAIGICSFLTTSLGVKLAHALHTDWIKRIFALVLCVTGFFMLFHS